ncbi:hypothetical protein KQ693_01155 [Thermus sp. PS18]|uniref:hypothetical protein n=1 Tax=Thermus sp. PS18 TaxID=2849039 RepID=UPI0022646D1C|nr:hypothetical protein [Thermus sp. PS18]UZX15682.1 hypothetical protein KQ693_01155 [Thermus sp. PS18]
MPGVFPPPLPPSSFERRLHRGEASKGGKAAFTPKASLSYPGGMEAWGEYREEGGAFRGVVPTLFREEAS